MRTILSFVTASALVLLAWSAHGATAAATKKTAKKSASAKSGSKAGKKKAVSRQPQRQLAPSPERYRQIQEALASKGYLSPGQATGQWDDTSITALKRFQTDQNIDASGKINSLSLIALGLGPKHDSAVAAKPAAEAQQ